MLPLLLLLGAQAATPQMLTAPVQGEMNRTLHLRFQNADAGTYRTLSSLGSGSRWVVVHWTVQPGRDYTLDYRYPRLGASYCVMLRDGDPFGDQTRSGVLGSTCGGWFPEGRAPNKPKHVAKYLLRVAPDSPGSELYVVFSYRPRPEEPVAEPEVEITLRSPAEPGVMQETPMPGWESEGRARFYTEWSNAALRLERHTPAAPPPAPAVSSSPGLINGEIGRQYKLNAMRLDSQKYKGGLQPRSERDRFLVFRWNVQPGADYTLDLRYLRLGANYCLTLRDGNPLAVPPEGAPLGGACWGYFMEGRAPEKPKEITKYAVRIAPDSPGRELYMVFAYIPRDEERVAEPELEVALRAPADPGVGQEVPMPGWESRGPSRFYSEWSPAPMRLTKTRAN